jgi:hypothetical protein
MAQIGVVIAQSQSLKEKRMVLRRMKDRVRDKVGVALSEVGEQDHRQRAELGVAVTSSDRGKALETIDAVLRVIAGAGGGDIVAVAKDAWTFDGGGLPPDGSGAEWRRGSIDAPAVPVTIDLERAGSGDKAAAGDDWVPSEWKDAE